MFEGCPQEPEYSRETLEILAHPEQVFDSDQAEAEVEHQMVLKMLSGWEGLSIQRRGVEVGIGTESVEGLSGSSSSITITWADYHDKQGMALNLSPITVGGGAEKGVLAYTGRYGRVSRNESGKFEFPDDSTRLISLQRLYQVPEGLTVLVKPTIARWSIGADELAVLFGENTRTMYMGLGFLLSENGHKWMHVGMHESGHLHEGGDENKAWTWANKRYADFYRGKKDFIRNILEGNSSSLFDMLEKPGYGSDLTIGRIMRYGLVSHALAGNAKIPTHWMQRSSRIMRDFEEEILRAETAVNSFFK